MPLAAGQTLTHCEILGSVGAGGMGEVYRARDTRLEREVAIKVLPTVSTTSTTRASSSWSSGETVSDVLAGVLEKEPAWSRRPASTPAPLRALLARCLAKDAFERQREMGDVRLELGRAASPTGESGRRITVGEDGTLAYVPDRARASVSELVWVDRKGACGPPTTGAF